MNSDDIRRVVLDAIGDSWDTTNHHGVDLRRALVQPRPIKVIQRFIEAGRVRDSVIEAWLVLIEKPELGEGYRVVASEDGSTFGLASDGCAADRHLVLCGWYGDFMTAFLGM